MKEETIDTMFRFGAIVRVFRNGEFAAVRSTHGLTDRDLDVIEFVGSRGTARFSEIVKRLQAAGVRGSSPSAVSQVLTALQRQHGLLSREADSQDFRKPIFALTKKGKKLVRDVTETRKRFYREIGRGMNPTPEEEVVFRKLCQQGLDAFQRLLADR